MRVKNTVLSLLLLGFLLGTQGSRVALWKDGDPTPVRVFPYSISCLPEEDQARLRQGIRFDSLEDLTRCLEDYFS